MARMRDGRLIKCISVLVWLIFLNSSFSTSYVNEENSWIRQIISSGRSVVKDIAMDSDGNLVAAGNYEGLITISKRSMKSFKEKDVFIAKFKKEGELCWMRSVLGSGDVWVEKVACDQNKNIIVAINFVENMVIDTLSFSNTTGSDIVLMKFDQASKLLWARHLKGTNNDIANTLTTDANGNIYLGGSFTRELSFHKNARLKSEGERNLFVAKFNEDGVVQWAERIVAENNANIQAMATDNDSGIYVAGKFINNLLIGENTLYGRGGIDVFIAKFGADGTLMWANRTGSSKNDDPVSLAVDNLGNAVLAGSFEASTSFNGNSVESLKGYDIFMSKYGASGNFMWVAHIRGENGNEKAKDIAIDLAGNIFLTGSYDNKLVLADNIRLNGDKPYNYFVAKFNQGGSVLWGQRTTGCDQQSDHCIVVDLSSNIYLSGSFQGVEIFNNQPLKNSGAKSEVFIWKMGKEDITGDLMNNNAK